MNRIFKCYLCNKQIIKKNKREKYEYNGKKIWLCISYKYSQCKSDCAIIFGNMKWQEWVEFQITKWLGHEKKYKEKIIQIKTEIKKNNDLKDMGKLQDDLIRYTRYFKHKKRQLLNKMKSWLYYLNDGLFKISWCKFSNFDYLYMRAIKYDNFLIKLIKIGENLDSDQYTPEIFWDNYFKSNNLKLKFSKNNINKILVKI